MPVRSTTILVADDDAVIRGNLNLLLRSEGYAVVEAANGGGRSRLELGTSASRIWIYECPAATGSNCSTCTWERLEDVPVIVIRPWRRRLGDQAMKARRYDYITKPFDLDEVRDAPGLTQRRSSPGAGNSAEQKFATTAKN